MAGSIALQGWAQAAFVAAGVREQDAATIVANLSFAERRGTATHGFVRMGIYLERMAAGGIVPDALPTVARQQGATAVIDCADGPGAVGAMFATRLAAELAALHGVGLVAGRDCNHFGAAGFYAEQLAEQGMLGIVLCNTDIVMAPPGGGRRVLGTNPIAVAAPARTRDGLRPLLDMAASHVAYGKLILAAQTEQPIPLGWAVDSEGRPTTDARAGLDGAILPAAGPKGFGLAFMIDVLSMLGGGPPSPEVGALYGDRSTPQRLGFAVIAADPDAFGTRADFADRVCRLADFVHSGGVEGEPPPMIPGEPEQRRESQTGADIALAEETEAQLREIGERLGIPFPTVEASQ